MLGTMIRQERLRQRISQEALCHGICSASYLSKIENDAAECSGEIYKKLFARLKISYTEDEKSLAALDKEYENVFSVLRSEGYFWFADMGVSISPLCEKMIYSPRHVEASLLCALDRFFKTGEVSSAVLELPSAASGESTKLLRTLIRALYLAGNRRYFDAETAMQSIENISEPWTIQAIGLYCYRTGRYGRAEEKLHLAYSGFAEIGEVRAMLDTLLLLGAVASGNMDMAAMCRYARITRRINSVVGNQKAEVSLSYNLGATCLMLGDAQQGKNYLTECRKTAELIPDISSRIMSMMYQKLAFAHALLGEHAESCDCLAHIDERELCGHLLTFLSFIRSILEHPDWKKEPICCELLERCHTEALKDGYSVGFARFYVFYLLEIYRAQRKYKSACKLLKQTPFLQNSFYIK